MQKLKGVYKRESWHGMYEFLEFAKKQNPDFIPSAYAEYCVSVAFKVGKRRKLKSMVAKFIMEYPPCSCCQPALQIIFEFPKKSS